MKLSGKEIGFGNDLFFEIKRIFRSCVINYRYKILNNGLFYDFLCEILIPYTKYELMWEDKET